MRQRLIATLVTVCAAQPAFAEKFYGELINAASGAALPAAFERIDEDTLSYCYNDVEENCWDLRYQMIDGDVIQARLEIERKTESGVTRHTNIWTFSPIDGGYHGTFEIEYEDQRPVLQTEGEFYPKSE